MVIRLASLWFALAVIATTSTRAGAQPGSSSTEITEPPPTQAKSPTPFVLASRLDGSDGGGLDVSLFSFPEEGDVFGSRLDLFLHTFRGSHFGVYGNMPVAGFVAPDDEGIAGIGNLELGGAFAGGEGQARFVAKLGLALPTASDSFEGYAANYIGSYARVADIALAVPVTWLRTSVSAIVDTPGARFRADFGYDRPIEGSDAPGITHITLGAATVPKPGGTAFVAEISTASAGAFALDDSGSIAIVSAGAMFDSGFYLGVVLPLSGAEPNPIIAKLGFRFGSGSSTAKRASPSDCADHVAEWRSETDLVRKTERYEAMPSECKPATRR